MVRVLGRIPSPFKHKVEPITINHCHGFFFPMKKKEYFWVWFFLFLL